MALREVDAVCIGVGWTGGILAAELTKAGMDVVGLERGSGPRDTASWQHKSDELRYAIRGELFQNLAQETWTLRHNLRERALPLRKLGSFLPGTGVGGAGVHWNGATWRFHPRDFTMRTSTIERYGEHALPELSSIQDWGITYEELEPYYDRFEYMAGIAGKAGNIKGEKQQGGNPFEGPRARRYPVEPMMESYSGSIFRQAAAEVGYHPFPTPSANLPKTYRNPEGITRAQCTYCGFCERFGCEVGAKADPTVTVIPEAMKTGRFELRTHANAFRIVHDGRRAKSVLYYDALGRVQEQPAEIILVTAYVLNNARLLALSELGTPYDPRTGDGTVGKNYCYQTGGAGATGFFKDKQFKSYMGAGANGVVFDDLNADNFDHKDLGFIGGGSISSSSSGNRPILGPDLPPDAPAWGAKWKRAIREYYDRSVSIGAQGESPAYRMNHLDLDPTYRDANGHPLLRITFDWQPNERKMAAYLGTKIEEVMRAMNPDIMDGGPGSLPPHYDSVPYQSTHNTGGAIMGANAKESVVNSYLQMWDVPNVFVVGASAFPQNAGFNPTGTVGALAYRAADGIVNKYRKRPGPLVDA